MKIAVLLSGGVDSSVALSLLKEQGHDVTAFYLKIWLEDELAFLGDCPWEQDLSYARAVCEQLDVPLKIVPLQKEYKDKIISYTIDQVKKGLTPNPDMLCNTFIKFGAFYDAVGKEFDTIATGHYADVTEKDGVYYLKQTPDPIKDQTYFLARLTQEQLSRVMFPLGTYAKNQVRELAQKFDLPNKERKDSQGLCFLGKISFKDFIKAHAGTKKGDFVVFETGKKIAEHEGFWFYTLGQRQGIGLSHGPWYVVKKDPKTNVVYISNQYFDGDKKRDSFYLTDCIWNNEPIIGVTQVKLRHGQQIHSATVTHEDGETKVVLDEQDQGIAPGQFAVFYQDGLCVGSGVVKE
jgi:tRNA (5-methylaminomethyl-2-thiouridylate)-methyltransferase